MNPLAAHMAGLLLTLARVGAWAESAPFIGDRTLPRRVRLVVVMAVSLVLAPLTQAELSEVPVRLPFEILGGLMLGTIARLLLGGIETGGQYVGLQLGLGFAGSFDPAAQESSLTTRRMAYVLGGLAFISVQGFEIAITALALPLFPPTLTAVPFDAMMQAGLQIFTVGVQLAAPLLLAGFVANLSMAIASKAAPQLNVFSVMLALFLVVGGAVWVVTAPAFVDTIWQTAQRAAEGQLEVRP